jgi:hypothetical protein
MNISRSARLSAVALLCVSFGAIASSHREGPYIATQRHLDGTDLYMFRSYETGRQDFVTVIANYIPFQDPQGGPNFYMFDPNALYEIHLDNNGDAREDLSFQFRFMNVVRGDRRTGTRTAVTNATGGAASFDKPADNIGEKSFPNGYEPYARQHVYNVNIPGCATPAKVFVGQRKEPFFIAVGKTFDLINLNPLGPEVGGNNNDLEGKNVSTIAMELPISCITAAGEPVVGAYTTASLRQARLANGAPATGLNNATREGGAWTQVSRLGMPLVNEVVIGLADKDKFNASKPSGDAAFLDYVTNPTLPALIQTLYPSAPAPTKFPRNDLVATFLTGIQGVNKPRTVTPSEMLRLNTTTPPTPLASQNVLGVAGGDNAGFPNGRRPADDVVDVSLRVAMGALCHLTGPSDTLGVQCAVADAPAGAAAITDGVRKTPANYGTTFPYLNTPIPGNFNPPAPAGAVTSTAQ